MCKEAHSGRIELLEDDPDAVGAHDKDEIWTSESIVSSTNSNLIQHTITSTSLSRPRSRPLPFPSHFPATTTFSSIEELVGRKTVEDYGEFGRDIVAGPELPAIPT